MTASGSDTDSPWASDDVPVSGAAAPIVWQLDSDGATDPPSHHGSIRDESSTRRWRGPVAMVGLLGLVIAGVVWRTNATSPDLAAELDASAPIEAAEDTSPDTATDESVAPSTEPPATDAPASNVSSIELPPSLLAIEQPTELVLRTSDNLIHTVSLPSGRVRTVGVPDGPSTGSNELSRGRTSMVASPTATLMAGYDQDVVIAPRDGVPFVLDPGEFGIDDPAFGPPLSPIGWIEVGDADQFLVSTFDPEAGVERAFSVSTDGVVSPVDSGRSIGFTAGVPARGHHVVNDAGGVYLIDADRTSTRISEGTVLAASGTHVLLRECDERRQCRFVLQSIDDGERMPIGILPAQVAAGTFGLSLSPDGTAVSYTTYGLTNERVIVDLADGPVASAASTNYNASGAWAPDGSGEFLAAEGENGPDGLVFLNRVSGTAEPFGADLGQVVAIAVRYPESELEPTTVVEARPIGLATNDDAATDLDLVAFGDLGDLTLLDLDDRTASTWTTQPLPGPDDPQLFADESGQIGGFTDTRGGIGFVSRFGGLAEPVPDGQVPTGPLYPGPGGQVWARNADPAPAFAIDYSLVNLVGSPHLGGGPPTEDVRRIQIPDGTVLGGDSRGGIVFESSGDIYATAGGGVARVTSGDLLAIGASTALVRECDERLSCTAYTVDRATGERTPSSIDALSSATAADGRSVSLVGSISPDGRVALVNFVSVGTADDEAETVEKWFFFDLDTGNPIAAEHPVDSQPIIWNDAGSYAAYLSDGAVVLYEHETGTFLDVDGPDAVRALTRVDADFGAADVDSG